MKKRFMILIGTLTLSLMLSLTGWSYTHDITEEKMHRLEVQKQDDIEKKSTEIARLDNVIQIKNKTIVEKEKVIETKEIQIKDLINKADKVNKINLQIKAKLKSQPKEDKQSRQISRGQEKSTLKAVYYEATAYIALCDTGCTGITATGVDVRDSIYYKGHRVIAVDKNKIPLNSLVKVEVSGDSFTALAIDTGGSINGYRIDILVKNKNDAVQFGRKNVKLTILKKGE